MGAWIETYSREYISAFFCVAPYVGAWIETQRQRLEAAGLKSHPMWVRGLKQL